MNYPWLLKSKQDILKLLANQAQAILMHGNIGIGKKSLALQISNILLCTQQNFNFACGKCQSCYLYNKADTFHPDFFLLQPLADKNNIGIEEISQLITALQKTPYLGTTQVVLIYCIEQLTIPASNALLKILEEPNKNTIFILVSHNIKLVMPTIVSRCLASPVNSPLKEQGIAYFIKNNISTNIPKSLLNILATQPLLNNNYDIVLYSRIIKFLTNPFNDNEIAIDEKNTQQFNQLLDICTYWLYDLIYYKYTGKVIYFVEIYNVKHSISSKDIFICWQKLSELIKNKQFNLNSKLLLNIFIHYYQLIFKDKNG